MKDVNHRSTPTQTDKPTAPVKPVSGRRLPAPKIPKSKGQK